MYKFQVGLMIVSSVGAHYVWIRTECQTETHQESEHQRCPSMEATLVMVEIQMAVVAFFASLQLKLLTDLPQLAANFAPLELGSLGGGGGGGGQLKT